eukprot:1455888-Amphidinium_carterae.1
MRHWTILRIWVNSLRTAAVPSAKASHDVQRCSYYMRLPTNWLELVEGWCDIATWAGRLEWLSGVSGVAATEHEAAPVESCSLHHLTQHARVAQLSVAVLGAACKCQRTHTLADAFAYDKVSYGAAEHLTSVLASSKFFLFTPRKSPR